jgi:hypothetical protein
LSAEKRYITNSTSSSRKALSLPLYRHRCICIKRGIAFWGDIKKKTSGKAEVIGDGHGKRD